MTNVGAIRVLIRIQSPPWWNPRTGQVEPGLSLDFDTGEPNGPITDLLSLVVKKEIDKPCGEFVLNFAPREPIAGYTWGEIIPGYSLCEIWMQRYPDDQELRLVMVGLTGTVLESEVYGQQQPQRQVQVSGREVSCVLVDQKTFSLPPGKISALDPDVTRSTSTSDLHPLFSPAAQLLGMAVIDPELAYAGASPVDAIGNFVDMLTIGYSSEFNPLGQPLLNLQLPEGLELKDLLLFDRQKAKAALFDSDARLPASSQFTINGEPLWNLMDTWSDPAYMELFPISREPSAPLSGGRSRGFVEIVFRKRPYAGRIVKGKVDGQAAPQGTQFDRDFADTETVEIPETRVVARVRRRAVSNIQNLYYVFPAHPFFNIPEEYRLILTPLIDAAPTAPSSFTRYGLRLRHVADYYIDDPLGGTAFEIAAERQRLLWGWHRFEGLFWAGHLSMALTPTLQVGKRLVSNWGRKGMYEYYVRTLVHSINFSDASVRAQTVAGVDRGWPV
jgi:hypothetical protein